MLFSFVPVKFSFIMHAYCPLYSCDAFTIYTMVRAELKRWWHLKTHIKAIHAFFLKINQTVGLLVTCSIELSTHEIQITKNGKTRPNRPMVYYPAVPVTHGVFNIPFLNKLEVI